MTRLLPLLLLAVPAFAGPIVTATGPATWTLSDTDPATVIRLAVKFTGGAGWTSQGAFWLSIADLPPIDIFYQSTVVGTAMRATGNYLGASAIFDAGSVAQPLGDLLLPGDAALISVATSWPSVSLDVLTSTADSGFIPGTSTPEPSTRAAFFFFLALFAAIERCRRSS